MIFPGSLPFKGVNKDYPQISGIKKTAKEWISLLEDSLASDLIGNIMEYLGEHALNTKVDSLVEAMKLYTPKYLGDRAWFDSLISERLNDQLKQIYTSNIHPDHIINKESLIQYISEKLNKDPKEFKILLMDFGCIHTSSDLVERYKNQKYNSYLEGFWNSNWSIKDLNKFEENNINVIVRPEVRVVYTLKEINEIKKEKPKKVEFGVEAVIKRPPKIKVKRSDEVFRELRDILLEDRIMEEEE